MSEPRHLDRVRFQSLEHDGQVAAFPRDSINGSLFVNIE